LRAEELNEFGDHEISDSQSAGSVRGKGLQPAYQYE
jgi:hypothetical protein